MHAIRTAATLWGGDAIANCLHAYFVLSAARAPYGTSEKKNARKNERFLVEARRFELLYLPTATPKIANVPPMVSVTAGALAAENGGAYTVTLPLPRLPT